MGKEISLEKETQKSMITRLILFVERNGNRLPHPFWLFVYLGLSTMIISFICNKYGVSVTYLTYLPDGGSKEVRAEVVNLFGREEVRKFLANFIKTYVSFPPLGLTVIMMIGVGVMEQSGFLSSLIRRLVLGAPSYIVTATLAFVGINANLASDAGLLLTPTIGAVVFKALGKNPWIGIITGYAAASGGLCANLFITNLDVILAGITESAAKSMNLPGTIHPLINWFFMLTMTFVLTFTISLVSEKILTKVIGEEGDEIESDEEKQYDLTEDEKKGLRYSGITFVAYMIVMLFLSLPKNSFFKNIDGGFLPKSPLLDSVLPIIFMMFVVCGAAYGIGSKTITKMVDIPTMMSKQAKTLSGILVTMLPASLFVYLFASSKLAPILAVKGAELIKTLNPSGIVLIFTLILMCAVLNLFMGSSSAKWMIIAPIFVPLFAMLGFSPAMTQVAYRIGDSSSNIISPIAGAVPFILGLLEQYKTKNNSRKVGVGTMIALELPFSIALMLVQTTVLILFYTFDIP
ncbi:MAG: AbgT family transporter, partial [Fusobacteriaceae bacterium]